MNTFFKNTTVRNSFKISVATLIIISAGILHLAASYNKTLENSLTLFINQAELISEGINLKDLESLKGSAEDLQKPQYSRIKNQLRSIKEILTHARFIYIMGKDEKNRTFFFVDSESPGSPDESGPGDLYEENDPYIEKVFSENSAVSTPPMKDKWGTWVSALVPVLNPVNGKVEYLLGIDIDVSMWKKMILKEMCGSIAMFFVLALFAGALLFFYGRPLHYNANFFREHLEIFTVIFAGIILTVLVYVEYSKRLSREAENNFIRVSSPKILSFGDELRKTADVKLEGLEKLFESSDLVTENEFISYTNHLFEGKSIKAWGYIYHDTFYLNVSGKQIDFKPVLKKHALFLNAVKTSELSGMTSSSGIFDCFEDPQTKGFFIVKPVIKNNSSQGYVFTVVNLSRMLYESIKKSGFDKDLVLDLFELNPSKEPVFITSSRKEDVLHDSNTDADYKKDDIFSTFYGYGKTFAVSAHTLSGKRNRTEISWMIIFAGLFFTAALAMFTGSIVFTKKLLSVKVTERTAELVENQKKLNETARHLEFVLGTTKTGINIVDENYNIHYVDTGWKKTYGDPSGKKCYEYFQGEKSICSGCNVEKALNSMDVFISERILPKEKSRLVRVHTIPFISEDGKKLIANFNVDITEQRTVEEQLRQSQKMESIGRLAGGIAHDFNNMLQVIAGYVDIALMKIHPDDPVKKLLNEIYRASDRATSLTRQLLTFARKDITHPKILDLNESITETVKMLNILVGEEISVDWKPENSSPKIKMDPSQIDQILANLVINAKDAITGKGTITITTRSTVIDYVPPYKRSEILPGEYAVFSVADSGKGMNKETLEKIFEPFFTTKKAGQGTGLGLSTVFGIVQQNSGFIDVKSEPDKGTVFSIFIPVCYEEDENKVPEKNSEVRTNAKIMLVEDEPTLLFMTEELLRESGALVYSYQNSGEALKTFREDPSFDLLITDVVMPDLDGFRLANEVKNIKPSVKTLFMSGYSPDKIRSNTVVQNMNYIQKPFRSSDFLKKVKEVLSS